MIVGLLFKILLGGPGALAREVLTSIRDEVDKERLISEDAIKTRLQQLQLMLRDGELTEDEYDALEAQLMERLRAVREYQGQGGGGYGSSADK